MAKQAQIEILRKNNENMPHVVFNEESKTVHMLEIGQQQRK